MKKDRASQRRLSEFLSYVEAIPMEVLDTLEFTWETFPQYLDQLDHHLGVNVGNLIGHTAVRYYVMGDECQKRTATDDEIRQMQDLVRDGMKAGALGLSVSRNQGHFDPQGVHIPAIWADEKEIFALGDVLRDLGTGLIQSGGGNGAEMKDALMSRLSRGDRPRRRLQQSRPDDAPARPVAEADGAGRCDDRPRHPRLPDVHAEPHHRLFHDAQHPDLPRHEGVAPDLPVLARGAAAGLCRSRKCAGSCTTRRSSSSDGPPIGICSTWWDYMVVQTAVLPKNKWMEGKTARRDRQGAGQGHHRLPSSTWRSRRTSTPNGCTARTMSTTSAVAQILTYPNAVIGLSDGGAHVQFQSGFGFSTRLLVGMGAREAGHVAGDSGAAADLRVGLDLRPL